MRNERLVFAAVVIAVLLLGLVAVWFIGGWYQYPPVIERWGEPFRPTPPKSPPDADLVTVGSAAGAIVRDSDVHLLARLIQAEAANEPYHGKVAVGAVVLNRVRHASFPNTISGVIFQPRAFQPVANGRIWRPAQPDSYRAARDALAGWDPSHGALYFWNPAKATSPWVWTRNIITRIGRHVFAR